MNSEWIWRLRARLGYGVARQLLGWPWLVKQPRAWQWMQGQFSRMANLGHRDAQAFYGHLLLFRGQGFGAREEGLRLLRLGSVHRQICAIFSQIMDAADDVIISLRECLGIKVLLNTHINANAPGVFLLQAADLRLIFRRLRHGHAVSLVIGGVGVAAEAKGRAAQLQRPQHQLLRRVLAVAEASVGMKIGKPITHGYIFSCLWRKFFR